MHQRLPNGSWFDFPGVVTALMALLALLLANRNTDAAETGPKTAKVLWTYKSNEHFVAAPSLSEDALYIAALGAFNTGSFHALSLDPGSEKRELWTKMPPYLKLPVVSS